MYKDNYFTYQDQSSPKRSYKNYHHSPPPERRGRRRHEDKNKRNEADRLATKFIHEFVAIDKLAYYRRRRPPDPNSNIQNNQFYQSDPSIPTSVIKSEYERCFKNPLPSPRPSLLRRSTSLHLTGDLAHLTEYQSKYKEYDVNEFNASSKIKYPQNLNLSGDLEFLPMYRTSYRPFKFEMNAETLPEPTKPSKKYFQQYCNLKLEGEQHLNPEYTSQFRTYPPIEKSYSIPQLSHINFNGNFQGIPEYQDQFRFHDNIAKIQPIKRNTHLKIVGANQTIPEYQEHYKGYSKSEMQRTYPIYKNDTLDMSGEFSKDLPEYYESFKDPNVRIVPERMKCRKPYLSISGTTDYHPEYKSTYLDFPRSRPITKKPQGSIRFIPSTTSPEPIHNRRPTQSSEIHNVHEPGVPDTVQSTLCQPPEVRKAQMEMLKRERTFDQRRQIFDRMKRNLPTHLDTDTLTTTTPVQTATDTEREGESSSNEEKLRRRRPSSPVFKLTVENVDDNGGTFRRKSPRYGRRAINLNEPPLDPPDRTRHNMRNETRVIEGNAEYVKDTEAMYKSNRAAASQTDNDQYLDMGPSFVVLDEPQIIRTNRWMKHNR